MLKLFLKNDKGEAYVGQAVKIVIAIVLGAALLAGAVLIFNRVVLPNVENALETGFGLSDKYTDEVVNPEYANVLSYMKTEINIFLDRASAEERADFVAGIEAAKAEAPDAFPPNFEIDDFRDGKTFMDAAFAYECGVTYNEAVAFSKTAEGKAAYAEYFEGWFD